MEEALEANQGFRETVALHPHALVSANAQEAMLYLQRDELDKAASFMEKSLEQANETGMKPEFIAAMRVHMADIRTRQTRFRDVKLLIEQAIPFWEKLPPRVHFGPLERMFNDAVNAVPYLSGVGSNGDARSLSSFPLPYFPEIPLNELAIMIDGEEESLLQTRLELRSWAKSIAGEEATPGREMEHDLRDRIDGGLRALERRYADIGRRLEWASAAGAIRSYALRPERLEIEPKNMAAAELVALHSELHASALHAFFRVTSAGYRWDLMNAKPSKGRGPGGSAKTKRPDKVFHWLVPPKPGWTIPIAVLG